MNKSNVFFASIFSFELLGFQHPTHPFALFSFFKYKEILYFQEIFFLYTLLFSFIFQITAIFQTHTNGQFEPQWNFVVFTKYFSWSYLFRTFTPKHFKHKFLNELYLTLWIGFIFKRFWQHFLRHISTTEYFSTFFLRYKKRPLHL